MAIIMVELVSIVVTLVVCIISLAIGYLIQKAAVAAAIKETLWNLEISMRNSVKVGVREALEEQASQTHLRGAVKDGVQEALSDLEKNKTETEKENG